MASTLSQTQLINIRSDIKLLSMFRADVCRLPRKPNGSGKVQSNEQERNER